MKLTQNYFQELDKAGEKIYGSADTAQGDIFGMINTIIGAATGVIAVVLLVLIVYSGFLWMTSHGNDQMVTKAKATLTNATIGLVITISAYALARFVVDQLSPAEVPLTETAWYTLIQLIS